MKKASHKQISAPAAVVFDPEEFRRVKPQFADTTDDALEYNFMLACELVENGPGSPVPYDPPAVMTRKLLLYALVCHFCTLQQRGGGIVGAVNSAVQGSVHASFTPLPATKTNEAWYTQTECGATAWLILQKYMLGGRLYTGCFR